MNSVADFFFFSFPRSLIALPLKYNTRWLCPSVLIKTPIHRKTQNKTKLIGLFKDVKDLNLGLGLRSFTLLEITLSKYCHLVYKTVCIFFLKCQSQKISINMYVFHFQTISQYCKITSHSVRKCSQNVLVWVEVILCCLLSQICVWGSKQLIVNMLGWCPHRDMLQCLQICSKCAKSENWPMFWIFFSTRCESGYDRGNTVSGVKEVHHLNGVKNLFVL